MPIYLEENLELPLDQVLDIIQTAILNQSTYFGIPTQKSPLDAWIYQEIIFETRPKVIIEIGNAMGGSTLLLAHLCDLIGEGRVIGLDLSHRNIPQIVRDHPRIKLLDGDACENFYQVEQIIPQGEKVLVIEDSSHTYDNTLDILRLYSKFLMPGDYFIVEDSICHHGLSVGPTPGPYEAIETFIHGNSDFVLDRERERYFITWNPKGYLKRTAKGMMDIEVSRKRKSQLERNLLELIKLLVPPIFYKGSVKLKNRK